MRGGSWWPGCPAYNEYRRRRVVAEHRLARLVQLGIRQARYFGRAKTKFQLYLPATVANLTLLAGKSGLDGDPDTEFPMFTTHTNPCVTRSAPRSRGLFWATTCLATAWPLVTSRRTRGFQPDF